MKEDCIRIPHWLTGLLVGTFGSFIACVFVGGMLVQKLNDISEDTSVLPSLTQTVAIHDVQIKDSKDIISRAIVKIDDHEKRIVFLESVEHP